MLRYIRERPLTGRTVFLWFAGFFLVVFGANLTMSWFAVTTFSGVETQEAWVKARDYNDEIARAEEAKALGWKLGLNFNRSDDQEHRLTVEAKDEDGNPLDAMKITGMLVRPVVKGRDIPVSLSNIGNGLYEARVNLPEPGNWRAEITVESEMGEVRYLKVDLAVPR